LQVLKNYVWFFTYSVPESEIVKWCWNFFNSIICPVLYIYIIVKTDEMVENYLNNYMSSNTLLNSNTKRNLKANGHWIIFKVSMIINKYKPNF
jgi:hypothetical protein